MNLVLSFHGILVGFPQGVVIFVSRLRVCDCFASRCLLKHRHWLYYCACKRAHQPSQARTRGRRVTHVLHLYASERVAAWFSTAKKQLALSDWL